MFDEEEKTMMTAPVKPIQPMNINFNDDYEADRFFNWASSNQKDESENMNKIREEFKAFRGMRKKGF